jgi:hypothetical protein
MVRLTTGSTARTKRGDAGAPLARIAHMKSTFRTLFAVATLIGGTSMAMAQTAYLEITLKIDSPDRAAAAAVYTHYKEPFLTKIDGATSKQLLVRDDDVQVLHGFKSVEAAQAYLKSDLFNNDVVVALKPLLKASPEVRIYSAD